MNKRAVGRCAADDPFPELDEPIARRGGGGNGERRVIETHGNPEQLLNRLFENLSTGADDSFDSSSSRMSLAPASRALPHARRGGERDPSYRRAAAATAAGNTRHSSLPRVIALEAELELGAYAYAGQSADLLGPDDPFLCETAPAIGSSGDAGGSTQSLSASGPIGGSGSGSGGGSGNSSLNSTFTGTGVGGGGGGGATGMGALPAVAGVRRTSSERMLAHALPAIAHEPNQHFYSTLHERVLSYI